MIASAPFPVSKVESLTLAVASPGLLLVGCGARGWVSPVQLELGRLRPVARLAFEQWLAGEDQAFGELSPKQVGAWPVLQGNLILSTMTGLLTPRSLRTAGPALVPAVQFVDLGRGTWVAHCMIGDRGGAADTADATTCLAFVGSARDGLQIAGPVTASAMDILLRV